MLEEGWKKEFEEWWKVKYPIIKTSEKNRAYAELGYLQACKVRQETVEYEQTRNRNNIMQADKRAKELEERNVTLMKGTDDRDDEIERLKKKLLRQAITISRLMPSAIIDEEDE